MKAVGNHIGIAINRGGSTDPGNYQCRVRWMNGDIEKVQDAKAVTVADRRFSLGGYVFSASEPTGQVGLVADLNISVDLLARDGTIHKDISTKMLKRVRDFAVGDYVVHVTVPSLGRVDEARENVIVKFDDGSTRAFREVDPSRLEPIPENNFGVDETFPYHIGQRVRATRLKKPNRSEGTVDRFFCSPSRVAES